MLRANGRGVVMDSTLTGTAARRRR